MAHGGHCVARHEGQVVFVRHALPGERVVAEVTDGGPARGSCAPTRSRSSRPRRHRVAAPCPHARPGGCGGCDFQHADAAVPARAEGGRRPRAAAPAGRAGRGPARRGPGGEAGARGHRTGWAGAPGCGSRSTTTGAPGCAGTARTRSSRSTRARCCTLSSSAPGCSTGLGRCRRGRRSPGRPPRGETVVLVDGVAPGRSRVDGGGRRAGGGGWTAPASGRCTPGRRTRCSTRCAPRWRRAPGEHLLDLYAGVGLFAGSLAPDLGEAGRVDAVEADAAAVRAARRNLHDAALRSACTRTGSSAGSAGVPSPAATSSSWTRPARGPGATSSTELVRLRAARGGVRGLRPGRPGQGRGHVAGRRAGTLAGLQAYDLFPMTHHVECVALLQPQPRKMS